GPPTRIIARMKKTIALLALAAAPLAVGGCPPPRAPGEAPELKLKDGFEALDLTYGFGPETIYWPNATPFVRKDTARGPMPAAFFYSAGDYAAAEHGGTHMDAPVHFSEKGISADRVPPESLVGPAWVLDAREACAKDRDHLVGLDDFQAQAKRSGEPPRRAIVLVLTGWGRFWPEKKAYLGDDRPGKTDQLSFPGLDPALARALVDKGDPYDVAAVGIDTASIDRGRSTTFE